MDIRPICGEICAHLWIQMRIPYVTHRNMTQHICILRFLQTVVMILRSKATLSPSVWGFGAFINLVVTIKKCGINKTDSEKRTEKVQNNVFEVGVKFQTDW